MLTLLLACTFYPDPAGAPDAVTYEGPTEIDAVRWGCDGERDVWTVEVDTLGWTSGGSLALSGGVTFEAHEVLSIGAAPDGSWDTLLLELEVVADPRDVEPGKTTRYLCSERQDLAYRLTVSGPDGGRADCRVWGNEADWNGLAGYAECDVPLEEQ